MSTPAESKALDEAYGQGMSDAKVAYKENPDPTDLDDEIAANVNVLGYEVYGDDDDEVVKEKEALSNAYSTGFKAVFAQMHQQALDEAYAQGIADGKVAYEENPDPTDLDDEIASNENVLGYEVYDDDDDAVVKEKEDLSNAYRKGFRVMFATKQRESEGKSRSKRTQMTSRTKNR